MEYKVRDLREKFFQVDDAYLNGYAKLCGISATGVYMILCRHASKDQSCFPSKKTIAEKLGISERSVYTAVKVLENWNIIKTAIRVSFHSFLPSSSGECTAAASIGAVASWARL